MCPACSTTTSVASGRTPTSSTAVAGGVTRSCWPTITIAGTRTRGSAWRRSISISPARPSVHTSGRARPASPTMWSTRCGWASGPNCVIRANTPPDVGGAREHRAPEPVHASSGGRERSEARTQEPRDRAHRPAEQVGGRRADQRHAGDPRAEELRPLLGHREDRHGAHAVPHHHGRSVGRDRVEDGGDVAAHRAHRQVAVRRVAARSVRPMVHQHASEVVGQIDPLLVPDGHVQAEPVREQQHRGVGIPGRPDGDLGPVERRDGSEHLRRQVADRRAPSEAR